MVGGVERSFGTPVPFLIILYTKKIKNQGVLRKKSNTRSYFFEISQPSRICAVANPVFYFTFILYLFGEGVAPTKNAGSTLGTVQEKKSFPPSRRRAVRRSPVAGAAPPHFCPARAKSGAALKKRLRRLSRKGKKAFPGKGGGAVRKNHPVIIRRIYCGKLRRSRLGKIYKGNFRAI